MAWTSYRYTVPASGHYLLYLASTAPAPYSLAATVWAASSVFSNYSGELTSSAALSSYDFEDLGPLPAGTYTVTVRNSHVAAAASYAVGLVDLEAPTALAVNGAQLSGTIDSAGERDYATFDATAGQAFTLRTTAAFAGTLRVRRLSRGRRLGQPQPPLQRPRHAGGAERRVRSRCSASRSRAT